MLGGRAPEAPALSGWSGSSCLTVATQVLIHPFISKTRMCQASTQTRHCSGIRFTHVLGPVPALGEVTLMTGMTVNKTHNKHDQVIRCVRGDT